MGVRIPQVALGQVTRRPVRSMIQLTRNNLQRLDELMDQLETESFGIEENGGGVTVQWDGLSDLPEIQSEETFDPSEMTDSEIEEVFQQLENEYNGIVSWWREREEVPRGPRTIGHRADIGERRGQIQEILENHKGWLTSREIVNRNPPFGDTEKWHQSSVSACLHKMTSENIVERRLCNRNDVTPRTKWEYRYRG